VINNCPRIADIYYMRSILERIGCSIQFQGSTVNINAGGAVNSVMPADISRKIRSSIFMLGSMIGRFKRAKFTYPGGCEIGRRPIDLHLKALQKLGISVIEQGDQIICECRSITPAQIKLNYPSVGATENIMLAAVLADGHTVIENAACEPEIYDLQEMLNSMGARIKGAGQRTIVIDGVDKLHGTEYACMPDRIEAGTYLCAAAAAKGDITALDVCPEYIESVTGVLEQAGAKVITYDHAIRVKVDGRLNALSGVSTEPYPGFPTDMQAQMCSVAAYCDGVTRITENVFDNRMKHVAELQKMGADIHLVKNTAYITGSQKLLPAELCATDLRGGAALIIAALGAQGESTISNISLIDRGYEAFEHHLALLGADIQRLEE